MLIDKFRILINFKKYTLNNRVLISWITYIMVMVNVVDNEIIYLDFIIEKNLRIFQ